MTGKGKQKDPLPDSFNTEEEAGEFWDTHSTMDYAEYLEPADDVFDIQERIFEVQIEEDIFERLRQEAKSRHQSIPRTLDEILRGTLAIP
jgi:hypothetical protein